MTDSEEMNTQRLGGHARAAKLSKAKRSEIAAMGAAKRWEDRPAKWSPGDLPRLLPRGTCVRPLRSSARTPGSHPGH